MNETVPKSKYQFSIRTMFVLLLVSIGYWWLAAEFGYWTWIPLTLFSGLIAGSIFLSKKVWLAVTIPTIVIFFIAISLLDSSSTRTPASKLPREKQMADLAMALALYESVNGKLPPPYTTDQNGNRLHSWRTLILPHLDREDLFKKIRWNEPWDSPYNQQFHKISIPELEPITSGGQTYRGLAVVGPGTAWDPNKPTSYRDIQNGAGTSNTLLLIEVANSNIHWMEPRDLEVDKLDPQKIHSGQPGDIVNVSFADLRTLYLVRGELVLKNLKALSNINGNNSGLPGFERPE